MQMNLIPVEQLLREPFIKIVGYPHCSVEDAREKVREMDMLGVKGILLGGRSVVDGLRVLGKGCTSIVVKALLDRCSDGDGGDGVCSGRSEDRGTDHHGAIVALKIMRSDSGRASMEHEARMLTIANGVGVGPRLVAYGSKVLVMELVDGMHMMELVRRGGMEGSNSSNSSMVRDACTCRIMDGSGNGFRISIRSVLLDVLEQCFLLDGIGLDHGELGNMDRHVMVSDRAYIIDFESSSMVRRVSNVTSAVNYLLFGRGSRLGGMLIHDLYSRRDGIIHALRRYRLDMDRERFDELLQSLDLRFL
ncbi:MAG: hypothetical protein NZ888_07620 [Candidatus Nitrosocaldus sp.]|nr:hypothetical protein [Candidatus Nitrosocaldus sp.]